MSGYTGGLGAIFTLELLYRRLHDGRFYDDYDDASEMLAALRGVSDAVAELIAADLLYDTAASGSETRVGKTEAEWGDALRLLELAEARRAAALAAITAEQAGVEK